MAVFRKPLATRTEYAALHYERAQVENKFDLVGWASDVVKFSFDVVENVLDVVGSGCDNVGWTVDVVVFV